MAISNYTYSDAVYTALDGVTTMPVRHAIYPENVQWEATSAMGTVRVLRFLAERFGEYPFLNQKYYSATWNIPGGMEHQTCTSMLPGYISTGEESLNVHELAHHWFGDKITCSSFDHLWLNEGFATYCEALWREENDGNSYGYWDMMNTWRPTDAQPVVGPDSDQFISANVYYKGAWVLHMLRHVLGRDSFDAVLKAWANSPDVSYAVANSAAFVSLAEVVTGKNLQWFFDQWLYRYNSESDVGRPTYFYTVNNVPPDEAAPLSSGYQILLHQEQASAPYTMPLDVELVDEMGSATIERIYNASTSATESLHSSQSNVCEVYLDPDGWVLKHQTLSISTVRLPVAQVHQSYAARVHAVAQVETLVWTAEGLPTGLSITPGGLIAGIPTETGQFYFSLSAADSNSSRTSILALEITSDNHSHDIIVESRAPEVMVAGITSGLYQETGTFSNVPLKSRAPKALGAGSRFTTETGSTASFLPAISEAGYYNVYITQGRAPWPENRANVEWTITSNGQMQSGIIYLHPYTPNLRDKWMLVAENIYFPAGEAGTAGGITIKNLTGDGQGGNAHRAFVADAVRFKRIDPPSSLGKTWALY